MARPGFSMGIKAGGGGQVKSLIVTTHHLAALAAWAAGTIKLTLPERGQIVGVTFNVAEKGGTHGTSTVDVLAGSDSLLGSVIDVEAATAGTPVLREGDDLSAEAVDVAKDTTINITLASSGGSSPTARGATVQIDYVPLGD